MRAIWYPVRSSLRSHRVAASAMAVVLALVGGGVLTLVAGALRTASAPDRYSAALGDTYDASIEQLSGRPRTEEVEALPAVATVDTATFVFGGLVASGGTEPVEALLFAGTHQAFGARVVEGRAPEASAPGEFVATASWLSASPARLGDRFEALTITQEQADANGFDVAEPAGPTFPATLVGVIDGPSELEDATPLALFGPSLLDAGDVGVASSVGLVALEPHATLDDLRVQLDALPSGEQFGIERAEWIPADVRSAVRVQGQGLAVVAAIVAVAAVAVLGQLLSRQVQVPDTERLAMQAIGLTRPQLAAYPLTPSVLPIAVGSVGAGLVALAASGAFPVGLAGRVEHDPGLRFEPLVHVGGPVLLAALLVTSVFATRFIGGRTLRVPQHLGLASSLASRLQAGPAATGVRFALTRHPRDPGSVRAPLVGLVLVLGILVGALTFGASVGRFLDEPSRYGSNFDFATGAGGDEVPEEVLAVLEQDPDVTDVTLFGTLLGSVGSVPLDITGMQTVRGALEPDVLLGRNAAGPGEMVLGRVTARRLGVGVGERITVEGAEGAVPFEVTGLAVVPGIEGGDGIGEGGVVTVEGLRRLAPDATLGTAAVRLRSGATDAAARIGETIGGTVTQLDPPPTVVNLERVRSTPFLVAGSLGALVLLSLSHQLITSARRRRRDLAVLRALGADRSWVTRVLHWQVTVVAATVVALAIPLGIAGGRLVYQAYIDRIGARSDLSVPYALLAVLVVGLLVIGNLATVVPARRARQDLPARVLADE